MLELFFNFFFENVKNDILFFLNNDFVLEKLFFVDVNEFVFLNISKNVIEIFDDDLYMYSFLCLMLIVEFWESVKRLILF